MPTVTLLGLSAAPQTPDLTRPSPLSLSPVFGFGQVSAFPTESELLVRKDEHVASHSIFYLLFNKMTTAF